LEGVGNQALGFHDGASYNSAAVADNP
jgi:hypothetical protein